MGADGDQLILLAKEALGYDAFENTRRARATRLIAEGYGRNGDLKKQEKWYLKALELSQASPKLDPLLLVKVGEFYERQAIPSETINKQRKALQSAARYYKLLIENYPSFVNGQYLYSNNAADLGDNQLALTHSNLASELLREYEDNQQHYGKYFPCCGAMDYHQIYVQESSCFALVGNVSGCIDSIKAALRYQDEDVEYVNYLLADALLCQRDFTESELKKQVSINLVECPHFLIHSYEGTGW